jgi:uncharacterized protein involved in type VI secretion and phage assembly
MKLDELLRVVDERVLSRFYGKYEAVVTNVDDPLKIGRVRAKVPAVFGPDVESGWALPCAPFGGGKDRGMLFLPEVGDSVWFEFAGGEPSRPIWVGGFWGAPSGDSVSADASEVPTHDGKKAGPKLGVLRTKAGHRIVLDDDGGVIVIAHGEGKAEVKITKSGEVVIKAEKVKLGAEGASQAVVLGNDFMQHFNTHTHPTGVGPSGPPAQPMQSSHLSKKAFTE